MSTAGSLLPWQPQVSRVLRHSAQPCLLIYRPSVVRRSDDELGRGGRGLLLLSAAALGGRPEGSLRQLYLPTLPPDLPGSPAQGVEHHRAGGAPGQALFHTLQPGALGPVRVRLRSGVFREQQDGEVLWGERGEDPRGRAGQHGALLSGKLHDCGFQERLLQRGPFHRVPGVLRRRRCGRVPGQSGRGALVRPLLPQLHGGLLLHLPGRAQASRQQESLRCAVRRSGAHAPVGCADQSRLPSPLPRAQPVPLPDPSGGGLPGGAGLPGALRRGGPPGRLLSLRCREVAPSPWRRPPPASAPCRSPRRRGSLARSAARSPPGGFRRAAMRCRCPSVLMPQGATGAGRSAEPCPNPAAPPHGHIHPSQATYIFTESFNVTCDPGYVLLQGSRHLPSYRAKCQRDGTWDTAMPGCAPIDCGPPKGIPNGDVSVTATTYRSAAQYACQAPFALKGNTNGTFICEQDGVWRDSWGRADLPQCEPCS